MKTTLMNYLMDSASNLSFEQIVVNFIAAGILGMCIFISYKYSYNKLMYSGRFNGSLVMLTLISTLVMSCVGNNVALSLGMVGALSIVRFRTAVKDARDAAYIFWAVAVGICCGVSDYLVAGIGSAALFVLLLIFGRVAANTRYLLLVTLDREKVREVREAIDGYYEKKAVFRAVNTKETQCELIYQISSNTLEKAKKKNHTDLNNLLYGITGVKRVNIVSQNNEMNE